MLLDNVKHAVGPMNKAEEEEGGDHRGFKDVEAQHSK